MSILVIWTKLYPSCYTHYNTHECTGHLDKALSVLLPTTTFMSVLVIWTKLYPSCYPLQHSWVYWSFGQSFIRPATHYNTHECTGHLDKALSVLLPTITLMSVLVILTKLYPSCYLLQHSWVYWSFGQSFIRPATHYNTHECVLVVSSRIVRARCWPKHQMEFLSASHLRARRVAFIGTHLVMYEKNFVPSLFWTLAAARCRSYYFFVVLFVAWNIAAVMAMLVAVVRKVIWWSVDWQ